MELFNGDCLDEMYKLISKGIKVDAVIVDPPYGTTACRWDYIIPLDRMWNHINRLIKPNGAIVFTASQPFTSKLIMSNPEWFKQALVWCKNKASGHLNANHRHLTKHEDIILFSPGKFTYNRQSSHGHKAANYSKRAKQSDCYNVSESTIYEGGNTDRYPTTLIEIPVINNDNSGETRYHPTQKPIALIEYLINTYTNKGETILDFAMGSGTTGVACKNLNREFIGIEPDEDYFQSAEKRIKEEYQMQLTTHTE